MKNDLMVKPAPCGRKKAPETRPAALSGPDWKTHLTTFLREKGLRLTGQREKIASIALEKESHFEIQELVRDVRKLHSDISPATVYRNVKTLCEAGLLQETLESDSGVTLYERFESGHHDHIVCADCGQIFEFHNPAIERAQSKALGALGFEETRHQHVIYARCKLLKR
jgi:Fur family ferric uptake transcriptional regulator